MMQPTFFLSHGGGPWPWMREEMPFLDGLHESLLRVVKSLPAQPRAIVIISGHWEEKQFTIMGSAKPTMIYDYYGFPEHTYKIQYQAPGLPELADKIKAVFDSKGVVSKIDAHRGFDHGVYSLLYPMFPNADIPIVQISMKNDFIPKEHFDLGVALKELRKDGVLIIGSGNIFHNLAAMGNSKIESEKFDSWIKSVLLSSDIAYRNREILSWEKAPYARHCQPREDHLIPLLVALGAASEENASQVFGEPLMGRVSVSSYRFG